MKRVFLFFSLVGTLVACRKESNEDSKSTSEYLPMAIGDYWVYETYYNYQGKQYLKRLDSTAINSDTLINGIKYFKLEKYYTEELPLNRYQFLGFSYERDSLKNLVNSNGDIFFSENNFTDILHKRIEVQNSDTLFTIFYKMEVPSNVPNPVDSFKNLLSLTGLVSNYHPVEGIDNPRYTHLYYAKGIGKVAQTSFYFISNDTVMQLLVRYKVQ